MVSHDHHTRGRGGGRKDRARDRDKFEPLLAGYPPLIQGLILAHLTGIWLSGHPLEDRYELAVIQGNSSLELAAFYAKERRGDE